MKISDTSAQYHYCSIAPNGNLVAFGKRGRMQIYNQENKKMYQMNTLPNISMIKFIDDDRILICSKKKISLYYISSQRCSEMEIHSNLRVVDCVMSDNNQILLIGDYVEYTRECFVPIACISTEPLQILAFDRLQNVYDAFGYWSTVCKSFLLAALYVLRQKEFPMITSKMQFFNVSQKGIVLSSEAKRKNDDHSLEYFFWDENKIVSFHSGFFYLASVPGMEVIERKYPRKMNSEEDIVTWKFHSASRRLYYIVEKTQSQHFEVCFFEWETDKHKSIAVQDGNISFLEISSNGKRIVVGTDTGIYLYDAD